MSNNSQIKNFTSSLRETANKTKFEVNEKNDNKFETKGKESFYKSMNKKEDTKSSGYFSPTERSPRSPDHGLRKLGKSISHSKEKSPKTSQKINTKEHIFETPLDKSAHHPQELVNEAINMLEKLRLDYNKKKDLTEISLKYYNKVNDHVSSQQELMANSGSSFNKRYKNYESRLAEDSHLEKFEKFSSSDNNYLNKELQANSNNSNSFNNQNKIKEDNSRFKESDWGEQLNNNSKLIEKNNTNKNTGSAINYINAGIQSSPGFNNPNISFDNFIGTNDLNNNNSDLILDRSQNNTNSKFDFNKNININNTGFNQSGFKQTNQFNQFNSNSNNIQDNQFQNYSTKQFQDVNYIPGLNLTPSNRNYDTYKIPGYNMRECNYENENLRNDFNNFNNFNYDTKCDVVNNQLYNNSLNNNVNNSPLQNHSFSLKNNNLNKDNQFYMKQNSNVLNENNPIGLLHNTATRSTKTLGGFSNTSYVEKPAKDHIIDFALRVLDLSQLIYYFEIKCVNFKDLLLLDKNDLIELDLDLVARNRVKTFSEAFNKHCRVHNMEEIIKFFFRFKAFIFNAGFLNDFMLRMETNSRLANKNKNDPLNINEESHDIDNTFNIDTERNKEVKESLLDSEKVDENKNDDKDLKEFLDAEIQVKNSILTDSKNKSSLKNSSTLKKDNEKKYLKPSITNNTNNKDKYNKSKSKSKSKVKSITRNQNTSNSNNHESNNRESSSLIIFNRKNSNPKNINKTSVHDKNDNNAKNDKNDKNSILKINQNSKPSLNSFKNSDYLNVSDNEFEIGKNKLNEKIYSTINSNTKFVDNNSNLEIELDKETKYNRLLIETTKGISDSKNEFTLANDSHKNKNDYNTLDCHFASTEEEIKSYLMDYEKLKEKNEAINKKVSKLLSSISGNSSNENSQNQFNLRLSGLTTHNCALQSTTITKNDNEQTSNRNYYASSSEGNNTSCSNQKEVVSKTMENREVKLTSFENKNQVYNTINNVNLKKDSSINKTITSSVRNNSDKLGIKKA